MPSRHFFHKNRSQGSLVNIHDPNPHPQNNDRRPFHASPVDSPLPSPAYSPHLAAAASHSQPQPPHDNNDNSNRPDEAQFYQLPFPARTHSQRTPPATYIQHPSINLVVPSPGGGTPSSVDENPDSYYQQAPAVHPAKETQRKRGLFGLGNSSKEPVNNGGLNAQRIGRGISVRRKAPASYVSTETVIHPIQQQQQQQQQQQHQRHSVSFAPAASEEEEGGGAGLDLSHLKPLPSGPPIPEKEPLRSPQFTNPQQQEHPFSRPPLQNLASNTVKRPPLNPQGSASSSGWENSVHLAQHSHHTQAEVQQHHLSAYQTSPSSATSTSSHPLPSRGAPETLQHYYQDISRPSSQQSFGPPSPLVQNPRAFGTDPYRAAPHPGPTSTNIPASMSRPSSQQQLQGRGSNESQQRLPTELTRERSGYQSYAQSGQESNQASAPPQYGGQQGHNPPGANYRAPPQSLPIPPQASTEHGRSTPPPPSRSRDDLAGLDPAQLLVRHDELQDKYRKVKKYYFDKEAQVQQLQNTLAHQRLHQSRTSLDDNEYANRFSRLDGAINNLSFNIRRDWRAVPPWLGPYVNRDAPSMPTREMTAVGRACISRWLVDELLDRYFHPSLDASLSAHLKIIEKNLRRFAAPTPSEEEKDALLARISNWRLATLDGLHEVLASSQAIEHRSQLTEQLVEKLTASLSMSLKDPPPPGLEGGVAMIIELAVGIAANLPLESRDVFVDYVCPGALVNEAYMKVETGLPALTNPGESLSEEGAAGGEAGEKSSEDSSTTEPKDNAPGDQGLASTGSSVASGTVASGSGGASSKESKKKSMFGGLIGGGKKTSGNVAASAAQQQVQQQVQQAPPPPKEDRVRLAAFMAVEVRGRSVLAKAPVYVMN